MPESQNPYEGLPREAYWRSGVAEASPFGPANIYRRKWEIPSTSRTATAGSCFAQHISRRMKASGFNVLDVEPVPDGLPASLHQKFGYGLYSARYGNIYTVHQLLQLAREAAGLVRPADFVWEKNGRYYDGLRPAVEPDGLGSIEEVLFHRQHHVRRVANLFRSMDLFIFTLGLTEAWMHAESGTVFPVAPGTIAGQFDPKRHVFKNFRVDEILTAFSEFEAVLSGLRGGSLPRMILTVSPVPLTATASGGHILQATTYSKSVLRVVAGQLATEKPYIDYFPSFEIVTNQAARGTFYESNLRSVRADGVENVMRVFFGEHGGAQPAVAAPETTQPAKVTPQEPADNDVQCEEAILEAFA